MKNVVLLCSLVLFLLACKSPSSIDIDKLRITVKGTVTDSETGAAIDDVLVEVNTFSFISNEPIVIAETRTDAQGRYELEFEVKKSTCKEGKYAVWALKDFYVTNSSYPGIKCITAEQVIDIQLDPQQ